MPIVNMKCGRGICPSWHARIFVKIGKRINFVAASILHLPVTNLASFSAVKYIWLRGILLPSENLGEIPACEQNHAKILGTGFQTRLWKNLAFRAGHFEVLKPETVHEKPLALRVMYQMNVICASPDKSERE